jgi:predicted ATPase
VSLVLYLRYDAKPGHRLVIDEPELNLHPDNQRLVTRILAKAVNRGLKIMMSTHSDYVIRELNNLVMLGQGDGDKARTIMQELGYQPEQVLRSDQIVSVASYSPATGHGVVPSRPAGVATGFETSARPSR